MDETKRQRELMYSKKNIEGIEYVHKYKPMTSLEFLEAFKDDLTEEEYKELKEYFEYNLKSRVEKTKEQIEMYNKYAERPFLPNECYKKETDE